MAKTARMEKIEAMLSEDPNDSFLRYSLGMEYVGLGDDRTAVAKFRELIELKPEDSETVPAFHMAGQALIRLGQEADARLMLLKGIELARRDGDLHAAGEMDGLLTTLD